MGSEILAPVVPSATANQLSYRLAEVFMFATCTHKCGYCWYAESGEVLDIAQLDRFRDPHFLDQVTNFFLSRSKGNDRWLLQLTGGEPLIAPNLDRLLTPLIEAGNRVAFYTALLIGQDHPGFRFLLQHSAPEIDYVMASFHPEAELDEKRYFAKIRMLKDAGHRIFLRFVGQPRRLDRLRELSEKCQRMDICFYPTTLLSNRYPGAYTEAEKDHLSSHFSSLAQYIQLEGGIATDGLVCHAGNRVIGINLQTGDITPCVSVTRPSIGNVFENRLELYSKPIQCPEPGKGCACDIHFQQNIVITAGDRPRFEKQLSGFVPAEDLRANIIAMRKRGIKFYSNRRGGTGDVVDDTRSFYSLAELKKNYAKRLGAPKTVLDRTQFFEVRNGVGAIHPASNLVRIYRGDRTRIVTAPERWSYAAVASLTPPLDTADEIWVRVRATVCQGQAGFGIFDKQGADFQDRAIVNTASHVQTFFLRIEDPATAANLIIQNMSPDTAAEVLLEQITVLRTTAS